MSMTLMYNVKMENDCSPIFARIFDLEDHDWHLINLNYISSINKGEIEGQNKGVYTECYFISIVGEDMAYAVSIEEGDEIIKTINSKISVTKNSGDDLKMYLEYTDVVDIVNRHTTIDSLIDGYVLDADIKSILFEIPKYKGRLKYGTFNYGGKDDETE